MMATNRCAWASQRLLETTKSFLPGETQVAPHGNKLLRLQAVENFVIPPLIQLFTVQWRAPS
jgi:hypothetical protein